MQYRLETPRKPNEQCLKEKRKLNCFSSKRLKRYDKTQELINLIGEFSIDNMYETEIFNATQEYPKIEE